LNFQCNPFFDCFPLVGQPGLLPLLRSCLLFFGTIHRISPSFFRRAGSIRPVAFSRQSLGSRLWRFDPTAIFSSVPTCSCCFLFGLFPFAAPRFLLSDPLCYQRFFLDGDLRSLMPFSQCRGAASKLERSSLLAKTPLMLVALPRTLC